MRNHPAGVDIRERLPCQALALLFLLGRTLLQPARAQWGGEVGELSTR